MAIGEVPGGAQLAMDLEDDRGRVLMKEGTRLTDEKRAALARRGVEHVVVYEENALSDEEVATRRAEITARVEARFAAVAGQPLMDRLKEVLLDYRLEVLR